VAIARRGEWCLTGGASNLGTKAGWNGPDSVLWPVQEDARTNDPSRAGPVKVNLGGRGNSSRGVGKGPLGRGPNRVHRRI